MKTRPKSMEKGSLEDTEMTGMLGLDDMRDLLHQAMLGLTRMQIYTVLSEAEACKRPQNAGFHMFSMGFLVVFGRFSLR